MFNLVVTDTNSKHEIQWKGYKTNTSTVKINVNRLNSPINFEVQMEEEKKERERSRRRKKRSKGRKRRENHTTYNHFGKPLGPCIC